MNWYKIEKHARAFLDGTKPDTSGFKLTEIRKEEAGTCLLLYACYVLEKQRIYEFALRASGEEEKPSFVMLRQKGQKLIPVAELKDAITC